MLPVLCTSSLVESRLAGVFGLQGCHTGVPHSYRTVPYPRLTPGDAGEGAWESNPPARLVTPPNWTGQVACAQLELLPVATSAALTIRAQLVTGGWCVVAVKPKVPA